VAEATVEKLICSGFRLGGKALGQVYQCWWRICREIKIFFSRLEYHMFYVLYPFVTYLLTLPLICLLKLQEHLSLQLCRLYKLSRFHGDGY
jgi:hypothetical protein